MELERVAAEIRPRAPWEAVDLGFTLVRAWWKPLFLPAFAVLFPLAVGLLALGRDSPGWTLFGLWWAKPLAERVYLFVAGRALFGRPPALRETLAAVPRLWTRGLWAALFVERLTAARSFRMPVRQLEGLTGARERERARVLAQQGAGPATVLTGVCLALEGLLFLALLGLASLLASEAAEARGQEAVAGLMTGEGSPWTAFALGVGWLATATLVGPFYAVAGFALYLNRRTLLEGWNVEIAFRRLARLLRAGRTSRVLVAALALALPSAGWAAPSEGIAQPSPDRPDPVTGSEETPAETGVDLEVREALGEVLAQPEFSGRRTVRRLRWKGPDLPETADRGPGWQVDVAPLVEGALWLGAVAVAALALAAALRRAGSRGGESPRSRAAPPSPVRFGVDLHGEALPADVPGAAIALLEAGRTVPALSLLFRAALAFLVAHRGLEVQPSWTEGECLRRLAGRLGGGGEDYLARLTVAWQAAAYAHRPPPAAEVRGLCAQWAHHFGGVG